MKISSEKIQEAKDKLGDRSAKIIAEDLKLSGWENGKMIKSIFKDEKSPSMHWHSESKAFKCFATGKTYDLLTHYMSFCDLTFNEAAKKLLKTAEVEYHEEDATPSQKQSRAKLLEGHVMPADEPENDRGTVNAYMAKRGISTKTLDYCNVKQDASGNVAFQFLDVDGSHLSTKYRVSRGAKNGDKKWWWQSKTSLLYGMNRIDTSRILIIVEGIIDRLSCVEAGFYNSVSIDGGASDHGWIDFNWASLQDVGEFVLFADDDVPGQKMISDIIPRLGEAKCKVVKPGKEIKDKIAKYYKDTFKLEIDKVDANNVLLACGADQLQMLINNAEPIPNEELMYLMDIEDEDVSDMEKISTGYSNLDEIIYGSFMGCFTILSGQTGCVDKDTEFFNGFGWKKISEYVDGDSVMQYNIDTGVANVIKPLAYIKEKSDHLWHFETKYGLDQCLSDEHTVLYKTRKGHIHKKKMSDLIDLHNGSKQGFSGLFLTSFDYEGIGIGLSEDLIRLYVAAMADGSYYYNRTNESKESFSTCRFNLKKSHKKDRLLQLIDKSNLQWWHKDNVAEGYDTYYVVLPIGVRIKHFPIQWYNMSKKEMLIVFDEIQYWDCRYKTHSFSTTNKQDADFVQFLYSSLGYRSTIQESNRMGRIKKSSNKEYVTHSIDYNVLLTSRNEITLINQHNKTDIKCVIPEDGYKYCFTMPLGTLVLRRNNKIFITGNSGKSTIANQICVMSPLETGKKVFLYSGELPDKQIKNWLMKGLAGLNHQIPAWHRDGKVARYIVTKEANRAISKYYRNALILYHQKDGVAATATKIINAMEYAFKRNGATFFEIDNLMVVENDNPDDTQWEAQKKFAKMLLKFANTYNVNVTLVAHPHKLSKGEEIGASALSGASELGNLCHRLLWVDSLKNDKDGYNSQITILKDRTTGRAWKKCKLFYDPRTMRLYSNKFEQEFSYGWEKSYNIKYDEEIINKLAINAKDEGAEVLGAIPE